MIHSIGWTGCAVKMDDHFILKEFIFTVYEVNSQKLSFHYLMGLFEKFPHFLGNMMEIFLGNYEGHISRKIILG